MTMFEESPEDQVEGTAGVGALTADEQARLEKLVDLGGLYADDEKVAPLLARAREFQPDWLREHWYLAQPNPYQMCRFRKGTDAHRLLGLWLCLVQDFELLPEDTEALAGRNRAQIEKDLLEAASREHFLTHLERCRQDHTPGIVPFDAPLDIAISLLETAGHIRPGQGRNKVLKKLKAVMAELKETD